MARAAKAKQIRGVERAREIIGQIDDMVYVLARFALAVLADRVLSDQLLTDSPPSLSSIDAAV